MNASAEISAGGHSRADPDVPGPDEPFLDHLDVLQLS